MEIRNIIKLFVGLTLFAFPSVSTAQQDPMYSMYMLNPLVLNPAYAGSLEQMQVTGLFRKQWNNVPGAPITSTLSFHNSIKEKNMGYGMTFINDQIGKIQTNGFLGIYSYTLEFEKSKLAFGAQVGARNFSAKLSDSNLSLDNSYDAAFANNVSQWSFNFGTGAFWYGEKWFVGISIPHLRNHLLDKDNLSNLSNEARLRTHYFLNGGYLFTLNDDFELKASSMIKQASGAPVQADINANLYYQQFLGLGFSYRTGDAFLAIAEVKISKNFWLGLAYDKAISKIRKSLGGSFEIAVKYEFMKDKSDFSTRLF